MSLLSLLLRSRSSRAAGQRPRLRLEALEDRTVLSTLYVVVPGAPLDATHYSNYNDAFQQAAPGDTIQIEPGAAVSSVGAGVQGQRTSGGQVGSTSLTVDNFLGAGQGIRAGEMVTISGGGTTTTEDRLVVATQVDGTGLNRTLFFNLALNADHSSLTSPATVTTKGILGIDTRLTIQGDTGVPAAITGDIEVLPSASQVTFQEINYLAVDPLTIDPGSNQTRIVNSFLTRVFTPTAPGGITTDGIVLSGNHIAGNVVMNYWTSPQITNNVFTTPAGFPFALEGLHAESAFIQGNSFTVSAGEGIRIVDAQNVQVLDNSVTVRNSSSTTPNGMEVLSTNSIAGTDTSVTIKNNVFSTAGTGRGLLLWNEGNISAILDATVEGNDFHGNKVGVEIRRVNLGATGIDLGGGDGLSRGANNFRDFTAAGTASGKFAIYRDGTNATPTNRAFYNLFSVADPNTVIKDGTHNTTTGGGTIGTGLIDIGATQLTADQAYVQTLYNHFLGRSGTVDELNGWVTVLQTAGRTAVDNAIFHSPEGLGHVVDAFYLHYLQRSTAGDPGRDGWIHYLQAGHTEEDFAVALIASPEYLDRVRGTFGGIDSSFVESLYNKVLGHNGSAADVAGWVSQLPTLGRAGVARSFLGSSDYRTTVVQSYYLDLLHRASLPAASEVNGWVNSGLDLLTIEFVFAITPEFYANS
jgi:hypothetical protein